MRSPNAWHVNCVPADGQEPTVVRQHVLTSIAVVGELSAIMGSGGLGVRRSTGDLVHC